MAPHGRGGAARDPALIALTAAVGVGVLAADRIIMVPGTRVVAQAVHRAVSFSALAFLATHIVLEILARRSRVIDVFVPFLARGRTFYIGLGTVASDLVVLIVVTGIARGRFAGRRPWTWRAIHVAAYLAWPMSIGHGLLAGREGETLHGLELRGVPGRRRAGPADQAGGTPKS